MNVKSKQKRKIVFLIEQLSNGGAERVTSELANAICNKSYEVHIITYVEDKNKEYYLDDQVVRHNIEIRDKRKVRRVIKRNMETYKVIKEIEPSCVVSLSLPITNVRLTLLLFATKIPLILSERNAPKQYPTSLVQRILRDIVYRMCSGVVFQTEDAKQFFAKSIRKKSVVISNPINSLLPERFDGEKSSSIVNFCRLSKQKNLDMLIDSFSYIVSDYPEYSLHIYGDGPEKERLLKKIEEYGLEEKIIIHEYSTNIYEQIKNATLYVSTSDYEGISNSMLEALALGIPTISTDCPAGGAREMIQNGINGYLVPVNNRKELVKTMRHILDNPNLAKQLSDEGYKLRKNLSVERISELWLKYIEFIIDKG